MYYLLFLSIVNRKIHSDATVSLPKVLDNYSTEVLSRIGWVLYRSNHFVDAEKVFLTASEVDPEHFQVNIGLIYSRTRMKDFSRAEKALNALRDKYGESANFLYAQAFLHEQKGDFWAAVQSYEKILSHHPEDRVARKLQLTNLSQLGATTQAEIEARKHLPDEAALHDSLLNNHAIVRLHWDEALYSLKALAPLLKKQVQRARFDHVPSLIYADQASKAVDAYEILLRDNIKPPLWLQQIAAGAYLTIEQREISLAMYNNVLESWPKSFDSRLGKFYALTELQRWKEAESVLIDLEGDKRPWKFGKFPNERVNPNRVAVAMARGTWLVGQQRLPEAEKHFTKLYEAAPGNIDFRIALANLHLFRGWKRRALREFRIIDALQSRNHAPAPRLGLSNSLNALQKKKEARLILHSERSLHPNSPQTVRLGRSFEVEEMSSLSFRFKYENSQDGVSDWLSSVRYIQPVSHHTNLFFDMMKRQSGQQQISAKFERFGVGINHTFNSNWHISEVLSIDYGKGADFGSLSRIIWTPSDYWNLELFYNSFMADISLRARVFDITSDQAGLAAVYRWSDWRETGVSLSRSEFSDGNMRFEGSVYYGQNILAMGDWRLHAKSSMYTSHNSQSGGPYFSPRRDMSLSATLMVEHNAWHRYESMIQRFDRRFTHRLYLTAGNYWQSAFQNSFLQRFRYEQEIDFSDTHHLRWGINWGRRAYDGLQVGTYIIDGSYWWKF